LTINTKKTKLQVLRGGVVAPWVQR